MLLVTVGRGRTREVFGFAGDEITIGRGAANDVVIRSANVSRRHLRVRVDRARGEVLVHDLGSASGFWVDDRRRPDGEPIGPAETIRIGDTELQLRWDPLAPDAAAPAEQGFLARLAEDPRDHATRVVYADWLEERGQHERAAFLRIQLEIAALAADDPAFGRVTARLRELAAQVGTGWRACVAMVRIEASTCGKERVALDFACPKRWDEMAPGPDPGVRTCGACREAVFYCTSIEQARTHAENGGCVAIDARVERRPDDLDARAARVAGVRGRAISDPIARRGPLTPK